jgi:hypothetical protein
MAFTYQLLTSIDDFLVKIVNFATAVPAIFTDQGTVTDTNITIYILEKGGLYWNFRLDTTKTYIDVKISYSLLTIAGDFDDALGSATYTFGLHQNNVGTYNPNACYLYKHNDCLHCVLELSIGLYNHMSFGVIDKIGTWTGGEYITVGMCAPILTGNFNYNSANTMYPFGGMRTKNGAIRTDTSLFDPIGYVTGNTGSLCDMSVKGGMLSLFIPIFGANSFNTRSPALPVYVRLWDTTFDVFNYIGIVPGVRYVNIQNNEPASTVEAGTYRIFPIFSKSLIDLSLLPWSANDGLAYLES